MTQDKTTDQIIDAESTDADIGDADVGGDPAATSGSVAGGGVDGAQRFKDKDEREKQSRLDELEAEKQSHERQMREATVGAAKGETATNAGLDQVEAFNSGYSSRGKAGTGRGDGWTSTMMTNLLLSKRTAITLVVIFPDNDLIRRGVPG